MVPAEVLLARGEQHSELLGSAGASAPPGQGPPEVERRDPLSRRLESAPALTAPNRT
ncbi:hypothetical protein AB0I68_22310 [Streptomyces sp. NPDC050448]|uniref:hypothetical protein n=1 Tax=Streptomyces sp. NPDC050448 TaxID=3155404 RepID=UPI00342DB735